MNKKMILIMQKKVTAVLRDFSSKRKNGAKDNNGLPTLEIQDKRKKRNKYDKIRYKSK